MILIRECSGLDELEACVQLQVETWGYDATDLMPRKAFLVMQKAGGQLIGEFATQRRVIVGYDEINPMLRQAIIACGPVRSAPVGGSVGVTGLTRCGHRHTVARPRDCASCR